MKENARVLLVDDDEMVRLSLSNWLQQDNYQVQAVADGFEAVRLIEKQNWDIVLLDLKIPGMDGIEVLRTIKKRSPATVVVMMTGYASIETSVLAMREGAYDYIVKPLDVDEITVLLRKIVEQQRSVSNRFPMNAKPDGNYVFEEIIGQSAAMQRVFDLIRRVAETNATVLITGETGTGKELVARAVHARSLRRNKPFIAVSCGALPETLLESELFGYEKGAFTGAEQSKKGRFELAHSGTLFLDEIGDINLKTQVKLLRVLQEKKFRRLGGTRVIETDVRMISATNRDLLKAVETGEFRSDLYYRLNVVQLQLPPLRERMEDIPVLAAHFMKKYNVEFNKRFDRIAPDALELMMNYSWPGNVRELENVIERAIVIHEGPAIKAEHLPLHHDHSVSMGCEEPLSLLEMERLHIQRMLEQHQWNISRTARTLKIDRTTLHKKIKKYKLGKKV